MNRVPAGRVLFVHPSLTFSGATERLLRMVEHLHRRGFAGDVLSGPGSRVDAFRAAGIAVELAELPERPLAHPFAVMRTRRQIRECAPDIVYLTSERLAPLGSLLDRPYVLEVSGEASQPVAHRSRHLRAVVLPGTTLTQSVVNRGGLPRALIRYIEHGPATSLRAARAPSDPPRVGCAGWLDREHGAGVFLEAAHILIRRGVGALFFVFGEGPDEERLRRKARLDGIAEHVTVTSPAAPDTAQVLSELDVFVSCLLSGVPGWLTHEALALGLPSVISTASGAFGLVQDGATGLLVERNHPAKVADAIELLIRTPDEAHAMGERAAREHAQSRAAEKFETALDALIDEVSVQPV